MALEIGVLLFAGCSSARMTGVEPDPSPSEDVASAELVPSPPEAVAETPGWTPDYRFYVVRAKAGACGGIGVGDVVCWTPALGGPADSCLRETQVGALTLRCLLEVDLTAAYGTSSAPCPTGVLGLHVLEPQQGWDCK